MEAHIPRVVEYKDSGLYRTFCSSHASLGGVSVVGSTGSHT